MLLAKPKKHLSNTLYRWHWVNKMANKPPYIYEHYVSGLAAETRADSSFLSAWHSRWWRRLRVHQQIHVLPGFVCAIQEAVSLYSRSKANRFVTQVDMYKFSTNRSTASGRWAHPNCTYFDFYGFVCTCTTRYNNHVRSGHLQSPLLSVMRRSSYFKPSQVHSITSCIHYTITCNLLHLYPLTYCFLFGLCNVLPTCIPP